MKIISYPVGELQANCYFLTKDKDCIVVDPGDSADFLLEEISRNNYSVKAIIATHGHFDHVMGVGEMQLALSAPFYMNLKDKFLIERLEETARYFLGYEPHVIKPQSIKNLKGGMSPIEEFDFKVIETPGHTPGSVCLYFKEDNTIFTGDTLFKSGIGRYDFSYSDKNELFRALYDLFKLPEETLVYSGHGTLTTIGDEKKRY